MAEIIILTGTSGSGKTSSIIEFSRSNKLYGFVSPVINGKRYLLNLQTNEKRMLEFSGGDYSVNLLKVGRFVFKQDVFDWARETLLKLARHSRSPIIIDEYGHLELLGKGFEPLLNDKSVKDSKAKLIIVVRQSLIEKFTDKFKINPSEIIFELKELKNL